MQRHAAAILLTTLWTSMSGAGDWPMYSANAARDGHTSETLPAELGRRWTYHAGHAPAPAWPTSDRQTFDRVAHPVVAGGQIYFGSSVDGTVRALDAATGQPRWTYYTAGPVRFAPACWKDRLFVASDDGCLYCLAARDGSLHWKKRGGPDGRTVLGNDRLISAWPARGGPVVTEGIVYFAAGIWPSDGIYLHALDADSGKVLWTNDNSGSIYMAQPHGGANANSGVSAQGYLVVAGEQLLVPTGRAVPASFNRRDGKFQYFHLQEFGHRGGAAALALDSLFINGGSLFESKTGSLQEPIGAGAVARFAEGFVRSTPGGVEVARLVAKEKKDRKGETVKVTGFEKAWSVPKAPGGLGVIVAGNKIVSAGPGQVAIIDSKTQAVTWSVTVEGMPHGLASADGRLYVATDRGELHCFDGSKEKPAEIQPARAASPYAKNAARAAAAKEIVVRTGVSEGYCVDLGCGDGGLAFELAQRTKLHICAIDNDPELVAQARRKLDQAGLLGSRVSVYLGDPARSHFPSYFANLVVSGRSVTEGPEIVPASERRRLQRPYGGIVCIGKPAELDVSTRGALKGAGSWTHQYADAANTCCSQDDIVKGPLRTLWFRDSDFTMPQRHGRGPAPLFLEGRLFVEGLNGIRAADAYNGRPLWEFKLDGVLRAYNADHLVGTAATGSNICVADGAVYVRSKDRCYKLDAASGKKLAEFEAPRGADGKPGAWGYLAVEDGIVFGSLVNDKHVVRWAYQKANMSELFSESTQLFALDAGTGKLKWQHAAKQSIRHNALAIGGGKVYLIDRPPADKDRIDGEKTAEHAGGELLALEAATGKVLWKDGKDIFGTMLALSSKHDALLLSYQPTNFKLASEAGGRLRVVQASDGKQLWDLKAKYGVRPVLNDQTIFTDGGAWDLRSGEAVPFKLRRSYGCGQLAGSKHLLVFRSATLGYFDLKASEGVENFGGIRPGCWINAIPAGGIVLVPDASAGCQCSYLNQAWLALQAAE